MLFEIYTVNAVNVSHVLTHSNYTIFNEMQIIIDLTERATFGYIWNIIQHV